MLWDALQHSEHKTSILLESIWTLVVEGVVLLAKAVLAAASLHQQGMKQRQVLVLELTLGLILEPSLELGLILEPSLELGLILGPSLELGL